MSDRPTPLTDEASFSTVIQGELVKASFARGLELDRAALMEALEFYRKALEFYRQHMLLGQDIIDSGQVAESALATARANFPTP